MPLSPGGTIATFGVKTVHESSINGQGKGLSLHGYSVRRYPFRGSVRNASASERVQASIPPWIAR